MGVHSRAIAWEDHSLSPANQQVDIYVSNQNILTELTTNNTGLSFDMSTRYIDRSMHKKTHPHVKHPGKHTILFEGVNSSEEGGPIISGPDPTTYWQEICTVHIGP